MHPQWIILFLFTCSQKMFCLNVCECFVHFAFRLLLHVRVLVHTAHDAAVTEIAVFAGACTQCQDVVFVVDSSASEGEFTWNHRFKTFLRKFAHDNSWQFNTGATGYQV